jgi:hypothetical protein
MTHGSAHKKLKLRKMLVLGLTLQPWSGKTTHRRDCDYIGNALRTIAVAVYDRNLGSVNKSDGTAQTH